MSASILSDWSSAFMVSRGWCLMKGASKIISPSRIVKIIRQFIQLIVLFQNEVLEVRLFQFAQMDL